MEDNLYDDFGNYIGPALDSSDDDNLNELEESNPESDNNDIFEEKRPVTENSIILHEDKQYYADAEELYPGVEINVQDEDTQDINVPIIKPLKPKNFSKMEKEIPKTVYSTEYLASLTNDIDNIRSLMIAGGLHSGKTTFMDMLIEETHEKPWPNNKNILYTDILKCEHERGVSIISTPVSLVLQSSSSKHHLINIIDVPGHADFIGEVAIGSKASDGVLLIVDSVEGFVLNTKLHMEIAIKEELNIILVINKMDKYILDLRLPPSQAYYKLMHANMALEELDVTKRHKRFHPSLGNVIFSSSLHRWAFSINSYVRLYETKFHFKSKEFIKFCWGNFYFNEQTREFETSPPLQNSDRVFTQFFLEPLYKIYSQVVSEDPESIGKALRALNIKFQKSDFRQDVNPLLRHIMRQYFDKNMCVVDSILKCINSPKQNAEIKARNNYSGNLKSKTGESIINCSSAGPLYIQIVKLYSHPEAKEFYSFGRILSGTLKVNQEISILGEKYTLEDPEDRTTAVVTGIFIPEGRYTLQINEVKAGNWVLLEGIYETITNFATVIDVNDNESEAMIPFSGVHKSVIKVSIEALKPSDVPKMENGIRSISRVYPLLGHKVEESGEHVLIGTGELQLDCALYDLRFVFGDLEVKVAHPIVSFCETVLETSSLNCFVDTPNKANRFMMIAEPLDPKISKDIEQGKIDLSEDIKNVSLYFRTNYNWNLLNSRSIWAFGPDKKGPNILCDDTLDDECDKKLLHSLRDNVVQGFKWACKEGPLCDEPIRNVRFKIMNANISADPIMRGAGQIIPTARRLVYGSFLMASPRLMEPINVVEIMCPADLVKEVYKVLQERRGHGTSEKPKPGSPFFLVTAFIPTIESFGFETDLRVHTQGLAFCQQIFDHWDLLTSDPFDETVVLHAIEPADPQALAKDFMLKTRRRKGLAEEVNIRKYFDDAMLEELVKTENEMNN